MANGSFYNYIISDSAYRLRVDWTSTPNTAGNYSSVTAKMYLVQGSGWDLYIGGRSDNTCVINGVSQTFISPSISGKSGQTTLLGTITNPTIYHNSDGTKTCTIIATFYIRFTRDSTSTYYEKIVASSTVTLDNIARSSTISNITSSVVINGLNAVNITIQRADSTYTHAVKLSCGSYSLTNTNVGTSTSFVIPLSWRNAITQGASATATAEVTTYSNGVRIGTSNFATTQLVVPSGSTTDPYVQTVTISEAVSGISAQFNAYIQNRSKLYVEVVAGGRYGAIITKCTVTIDGTEYVATLVNGKYVVTSNTLLNSGSDIPVIITVTDSRGVSASIVYKNYYSPIVVKPYIQPRITQFEPYRSDSTGLAKEDGTYLSAKIKWNISAVDNLNTKYWRIQYKLNDDSVTSWTTLTSSTSVYNYNATYTSISAPLSTTSAYIIRLTITDFFQSVVIDYPIEISFILAHFRNTGKGLALGGLSTEDNFTVKLDTKFDGAVRIVAPASDVTNSPLLRLLRADGTLLGFLATGASGQGLNLHLYDGSDWSGMMSLTDTGRPYFSSPVPITSGGTEANTAAQARTNLGAIGAPVLLWSGTWSSGTITVDDFDSYQYYLIFISGADAPMLCKWSPADDSIQGGSIRSTAAGATRTIGLRFETNGGTTLTFSYCRSVTHTYSGSHGAYSDEAISEIWGWFTT